MRRPPDGKADRLRDASLVQLCTAHECTIVARYLEEWAAPAGSVLHRAGDRVKEWWLVASGFVTVRRGDDVIALLGPDDWWGTHEVLAGEPADVTLVAVTPVVAFTADRRHFEALLRGVPSIAIALLRDRAPADAAMDR